MHLVLAIPLLCGDSILQAPLSSQACSNCLKRSSCQKRQIITNRTGNSSRAKIKEHAIRKEHSGRFSCNESNNWFEPVRRLTPINARRSSIIGAISSFNFLEERFPFSRCEEPSIFPSTDKIEFTILYSRQAERIPRARPLVFRLTPNRFDPLLTNSWNHLSYYVPVKMSDRTSRQMSHVSLERYHNSLRNTLRCL